ncbi:MAG: DUF131 domain-containing protein [Chloroflexi bacterium]|nr:DUF131 domain-containing protein [Chloroflexota bacterium]
MFIKNADLFSLDTGERTVDAAVFFSLGFVLIVVGIVIIVAAVILASMGGSKKEGKVRGAGVVMIGPIPIIFGTDKKSVKTVLALALALTIIALIIVVLNYWLLR